MLIAAEGQNAPPAPPSDHNQEAMLYPWLSMAHALTLIGLPEVTEEGTLGVTITACKEALSTVMVTEAVPVTQGYCHSSIALTVKVILRALPVVLAAAA